GLDMGALAKILAELKQKGTKPKYIYTIPTVQNPTGSILSLERRHELLRLARQFDVPIFEDEGYADIVWDGAAPPSLYALDPKQVVQIGSFSKNLAPAFRLGYIAADWPALSQMMAVRIDGGTGGIDQLVAAEFFGANHQAHIRKITASLK